jgi:carboxyl-terminal processing protease
MIRRLFPTPRGLFVATAVATLLWLPLRTTADPIPGKEDKTVARLVCLFLQQGHLARPEIGDSLSKRLYQRFFKDLDPTKVYFLKSDVEEFKKFETDLDDQLLDGNTAFAYDVFGRLLERMAERVKKVPELVNAPQDFTVKEYLDTNYDALDWAKDEAELTERWRKRLKYELLLQRIGPKPLPDAEAKQKVISRYQNLSKLWKQFDHFDLLELYLTALTTSVDPHSTYMSPNTLDDFDVAMRLNLEGIGALLRSENGQTIVAEVYAGGPAGTDGRLKPNDKIIGVAQGDSKFTDVLDMKLRDVVKMIRGPRGTKVELKVVPAGKTEPVIHTYTRAKIELKNQEARAEILDFGKKADGTPYKVGVIDLPSFYAERGFGGPAEGTLKSATEDVRKLLSGFKDKGVDGVILDLRRNGGGALTEAVSLTGLFIDQGPIVQVKGSGSRVQRHDDPERGTAWDGPLMVLTSRLSASASEILAGALQDYGRALIVGDPATHGKGTVQMVVDLGNQLAGNGGGTPPKLGALKLTIQQFYRVNGDSTQDRGVAADVTVPSLISVLAPGEEELEHALKFDHVKPVRHDELNRVTPELKAELQKRSADRVAKSADFAKLQKRIDLIKARKAKKAIPLNEQELKAQSKQEDEDKLGHEDDDDTPKLPKDKEVYKFERNYTNNEILAIMEDFLQRRAAR